jgi:hypothetical protein
MVRKTTESGWNFVRKHMPTCYWGSEGTVEQESLLYELREDLLTGSRELGVRRTPVVGVTGKGQALILASFKFCNTTQGAKSASIILILLSHFEMHCWWHTLVNVLVMNRPSLEWLLLVRQLAYPRDTCCRLLQKRLFCAAHTCETGYRDWCFTPMR